LESTYIKAAFISYGYFLWFLTVTKVTVSIPAKISFSE
jgi:succinate-acetate transporter protein